jgi:hypothetical protein
MFFVGSMCGDIVILCGYCVPAELPESDVPLVSVVAPDTSRVCLTGWCRYYITVCEEDSNLAADQAYLAPGLSSEARAVAWWPVLHTASAVLSVLFFVELMCGCCCVKLLACHTVSDLPQCERLSLTPGTCV